MKYGLLSIAAMIPLLVLTVDSFVELRQITDQSPSGGSDEHYQEIQKLIDATRQSESNPESRSATDAELAFQLAATDLLDARPPAAAPKVSKLYDAADKWRKFDDARDFVLKTKKLRLLRAGLPQPPANEIEADKEVKEIDEFTSQAKRNTVVADFPPAGELLSIVDARHKALKEAIDRFEERKRILAAVATVREQFQAQRFQECLKALEQDELKKLASVEVAAEFAEIAAEFVTLRRRAQFRVDSKHQIDSTPASVADQDLPAKAENLLKSYEDFFRTHPDPPIDDDRADYTEIERRRDVLEMNLLLGHLHLAPDVKSLLTTAAKIFANKYAQQDLKNRTRLLVRQWLTSERGLTRKETPIFLQDGKKEAITKRGQRKLGFFYLPEAGVQTRFWDNKASFQNRVPPLGTERFSEGDLRQPPATPQYVKWADDFNETSEQLVRQGGTRDQWEKFSRRCTEIQSELVKYREDFGVKEEPDESCRNWDFRTAAVLAREIINHWELYEQVQEN